MLDIDFESGDNLSFEAVRTYEFLDGQFEISDGVDIMPGDYTTWDYQIRGRTTSRRPVSVRGGPTSEASGTATACGST